MTSQYPDVSERLAHVFTQWQIMMMVGEVKANLPTAPNMDAKTFAACQSWDKFADYVLQNTNKEINPHEWIQPPQLTDGMLGRYITYPEELFYWNRTSRRAFSIPVELQAVFGAAEFPDMHWRDILWPHDCFVLSLEKPLVFHNPAGENEAFDTILIHRSLPTTSVNVRVFPTPKKEGESIQVTPTEVRKFREYIAEWDHDKALQIAQRKQDRLARIYSNFPGSLSASFQLFGGEASPLDIEPETIYLSQAFMQLKYNETAPQWDELDPEIQFCFEVISVGARMAISWMLYLESLSSDTLVTRPVRKQLSRVKKYGPAGIITQPEQICEIHGSGMLRTKTTERTTGSKQNSKGFVRPHWRRAHYKRPRGSPLGAAKTVRVPAVLVRPDLVPLYGIISGTNTVMILEN